MTSSGSGELGTALAAALAERYVIERELGRGGMAVVYRAADRRHGRPVAIKVLHPELATAVGGERFLQEIRMAAGLTHPHILPVFDSGEAAGLLYYVMPFMPGESLRDRLGREGQLGLEEALRLTAEVGDALAYAHDQGVVHRDIKPENILLSGGHAAVADFGIARALTAPGAARLTQTGMSLGTPAYMSPEQATADRQVDGRSDQYSLASMLYEMLVGEPPFTGATVQAVIARRLVQAAPSVRVVRDAVPEAVDAVLQRALARVPADRFPHIRDFTTALTAPAPGTAQPSAGRAVATGASPRFRLPALPARSTVYLATAFAVIAAGYGGYAAFGRAAADRATPRIVVLPFENLGPAAEEYFSDGLTEDITGRLASIDRVDVIARTSAMHYKDTQKDVRTIARELDVGYVIEGSVRWASSTPGGQLVRVTASLVRVRDEKRIWHDDYTEPAASIFDVQSNIAERVAGALDVVLAAPLRAKLAEKPTDNPDAYDFYLRGNSYYNHSWTRPDVESAIAMYTRATQLDPKFALAFAQLGRTHAWLHRLGFDPTEPRLSLAKRAVDSALVLQPELPEAHIALALYEYWGRWNYDGAVAELTVARELRPGMAAVHQQLGNVHRRQGRWADAVRAYKRAADLDPRSYVIYYNLSETLLHTRQYAEAQRYISSVIELSPDFLDAYLHEATLLLHWKADVEGARRAIDEALRRAPPAHWRPAHRGFWAGGLGSIIFPDPADIVSRVAPGLYGLDSMSYYMVKGDVHYRTGQQDRARVYFDSARVMLERARDAGGTNPVTEAGINGLLGVVYAGLQRPREAVRSAERATELIPISRDAFDGPDWVANRARVHVMIGDHDAALADLRTVLGMPSRLSVNALRLAPAWNPLRSDPRFQDLIASAPAGTTAFATPRASPGVHAAVMR